MPQKDLLIQDRFSTKASALREYFETQFRDPTSLDPQRFRWDYWRMPDQYRLLRTPAYHYFPESLYMSFHKELVLWGRRNLGCWDISPPWLSCYIDGCSQEMHSDVPHGPWAFVYSISPKNPRFTGGETFLLKDAVLNFWNRNSSGHEYADFVELIPAKFNRLTVFDPRRPHGVRRVEGVDNPLEGRLVIHGWFSQPKTYVEGALAKSGAKVERLLNQALERFLNELEVPEDLWGTTAIGLDISSSGQVKKAVYRTQTLRNSRGEIPARLLRQILKIYGELEFPSGRTESTITVPLIFES